MGEAQARQCVWIHRLPHGLWARPVRSGRPKISSHIVSGFEPSYRPLSNLQTFKTNMLHRKSFVCGALENKEFESLYSKGG